MIKKLFAILFCVMILSGCVEIAGAVFEVVLGIDDNSRNKREQKTSYERYQEDMNKTYKNDETIVETDYQRRERENCIDNKKCEANVWIKDSK